MRPVLVLLHRYVGLATALFLFLAGLTGSLLAFHHEIDEWLNPGFYAVGAASAFPRAAWCNASSHAIRDNWCGTWSIPRRAGTRHCSPPCRAGRRQVEHDVFYLDPVSGGKSASAWAACCFQPANLVPWVLEFHHT